MQIAVLVKRHARINYNTRKYFAHRIYEYVEDVALYESLCGL